MATRGMYPDIPYASAKYVYASEFPDIARVTLWLVGDEADTSIFGASSIFGGWINGWDRLALELGSFSDTSAISSGAALPVL